MQLRPHMTLKIWLGSENVSEFFIVQGDTPRTDLSAITRIVFCFGGTIIDSDSQPGIIWWNESVTDKPIPGCGTLPDGSTTYTGNVVRAKLGQATGLAEGSYSYGWIKTYEATKPNGEVVSDSTNAEVYADACAAA